MASTHVALVTAGGTSNRRIASSLYGYCQTGASTAAKTVSLYTGNSTSTDGSWASGDLFHGLTITVRFRYSNTASNPTLNVNSTGAKRIYKYGTTSPGTTATTSWQANSVISLTYDTLLNSSGCWVMNDHLDDTTGGSGSVEYTLSGSGDDDEYTITATPTIGTATSTTIPAATTTDAGVMTATDKTKLDGVASGAEVNVQSNWNEADSTSDSYIQNKPTLISFDDIYPVGSIYMSVNSTNPGTLFGGTWARIKDTFLLSAGDTYTAGATGGEATHQLQANELPKIDGYFEMRRWGSGQGVTAVSGMFTGRSYASSGSANPFNAQSSGAATPQRITTSFGANGAHNNMPPYLVVYVWQRTA